MPKKEVFLSEKFKEAGYAIHAVGKWHLGYCDERYAPTFRGFDSFTGYLNGAEDCFNHTREESGYAGLDLRNSTSTTGSANELPPACHAACHAATGMYSTDVFTNAVARNVSEHDASKPLFLYMPFQSVHGPLQAPQSYIDKCPESMTAT